MEQTDFSPTIQINERHLAAVPTSQTSNDTQFSPFDRVPTEIRDVIFGYMIRDTLKTDLLHYVELPAYYSILMRRHLVTSPWIVLNKKLCTEHLQILLRKIELTGDLGSDGTVFDECLRNINQRLVISMANVCSPQKAVYPHIKGICLRRRTETSVFRNLGSTIRGRYTWINRLIVRSLEQLRRYHDEYKIPASKMSIHLDYGSPFAAIETELYVRRIAQRRGELWALPPFTLDSVQVRIWVADYDKSVASLDVELQRLRGQLQFGFQWLRGRNNGPEPWAQFQLMERSVEKDLVELRKLHSETVDQVTSFWKRQDGWYEVDDLFRLAKLWGLEMLRAKRIDVSA